ncbi:tRNA (guanine(9)-N1)-methyltransferase [Dictyocoela muelleri]|nr:tRNA (guanine(9)-N1)-methyltransferase [Dictyocoela muelleri]
MEASKAGEMLSKISSSKKKKPKKQIVQNKKRFSIGIFIFNDKIMTNKELKSLSHQIYYIYGYNKNSYNPVNLYFLNLDCIDQYLPKDYLKWKVEKYNIDTFNDDFINKGKLTGNDNITDDDKLINKSKLTDNHNITDNHKLINKSKLTDNDNITDNHKLINKGKLTDNDNITDDDKLINKGKLTDNDNITDDDKLINKYLGNFDFINEYNKFDKSISHIPKMQNLDNKEIIFLSPDAPEPLKTLKENEIYIIGGLVDRNRRKNYVLNYCIENNIKCRRLPIKENININCCCTMSIPVVFEILSCFGHIGDWKVVLENCIPKRKIK